MKKVMLLVAVAVSIAFTSCSGGGVNKSTKYRILDADGRIYFMDEYTFENGCIKFEYDSKDVVICGSFTLTKLEK